MRDWQAGSNCKAKGRVQNTVICTEQMVRAGLWPALGSYLVTMPGTRAISRAATAVITISGIIYIPL